MDATSLSSRKHAYSYSLQIFNAARQLNHIEAASRDADVSLSIRILFAKFIYNFMLKSFKYATINSRWALQWENKNKAIC